MVGDEAAGISRKFVGDVSLVERALVTLATNRGLMLVGEPGTAKSLLSELIAAAVSGDSALTVQGGAATTEDRIKYSWNYALLVSEGPSARSLVPAPMLRGMAEGRIVRFEEITRCPLEGQDCLLSLLSDDPASRGTAHRRRSARRPDRAAGPRRRDRGRPGLGGGPAPSGDRAGTTPGSGVSGGCATR